MTGFVESIARFGPHGAITGILTAPETATPGAPTVVIVNTGILHRIGNHRMYVALARRLAEAGIAVLRFDLSGIGDSAAREPALDPTVAADADLRDALGWLQTQGLGTVVLMGLCSGADRALSYAARDGRVRGLILLDPTVPPTLRFLLILLRRRMANAIRRNLLVTLNGKLRRGLRAMLGSDAPIERLGAGPVAAVARSEVKSYLEETWARVVANGAETLAIFTSGVQRSHNYREQLLDAFPRVAFGDRLHLHYLEGVEHLFITEEERALCLALVLDWLRERSTRAERRRQPAGVGSPARSPGRADAAEAAMRRAS